MAHQRKQGISLPHAMKSAGAAIRMYQAADPVEEGHLIASGIRELVGGVDSVSVDAVRTRRGTTEPASRSFSDIAVLFRTRSVRDALLPSLLRAGLPLSVRDCAPLIEEEPFSRLMAALRLVVNPADLVSRADMGAALPVLITRLSDLQAVVASRGIEAAIDEIEHSMVNVDAAVPEIALADEAIRESAREHGTDLASFLSRLSVLTRESEGAFSVERVTLLTFHAAKGLEFPVVFIAGAEEGIVPMADDPDEERRLFYVALTRARDVLIISHCARRIVGGTLTRARPSPFLAEIPADCVEQTRGHPGRAHVGQLTLFD
jgi:superfamily I DNA/RNA helicase